MAKKAKQLSHDEKIFKLTKIITDRKEILLGLEKPSKDSPEYWGFDCGYQYVVRRYGKEIAEECLDTALLMGKRKPRTFAKMKELTGYDDDHLKTVLEALGQYGLVEWNNENEDGKNPQHERRYILDQFVPGSAEIMVMRDQIMCETPEIADFFERMTYLPLAGITQMVAPGGSGIGMHVIPVEKAIPAECESLDIEHISYWLKKYEGQIGLGICSCRKQQTERGEGSGDIMQYWCMGLGDFADYCRETGMGYDITYEEALEVLEKAEEKGYVHQVTNIDGENKIFAICNCAVGVCNALRTSQLFNTPNLSASPYRSEVDPEKCVACGKCVEVCPAGAVRLGQKLCTKHGEIEYPKQELPDSNFWPEDKWNWNYKNENGVIQTWPTGTAPCKSACPLHIAIQGYIDMASRGEYRDALELIKRDNPFPAVCGAICHKYCELECTRGTVDEALAIDDIKAFIAAKDLEDEHKYIPPMVSTTREPFEQKIGIVGSGPAGLSCAYFLAIEGYKPVVFEKQEMPGGMMTLGIPNFRLDKKVVNAEIDILKEMGVEIRCGVEVGKDVTFQSLREEGFKGFFVGTGLQSCGKLGIPGDDAEGVIGGVDYVKTVTLGKAKKLSGDVVVIGGGNIGADVARTAIRQGAKSVHLYCLESYDEMPMGAEDQEFLKNEGIVIHDGWGQTEVVTKNGKVAGIKFRKCLSVKNAEGRFAPTFDDAQTTEQACSTVLFSIGQKPDYGKLFEGTKVELSPRGMIIADPVTLQTAEPDIFAGGDSVSGQKFVVDALAMGREGAVSLHRFVNKGQHLMIHRNTRHFEMLNKDDVVIPAADFRKPPRQIREIDESKKLTMDYEIKQFSEEQIKKEAERCLKCGRSVVDTNKCIGCGMCTVQCKFDAIHLFRLPDGDKYSNMIPAEQKFVGIGKYMPSRVAGIIKKKVAGR